MTTALKGNRLPLAVRLVPCEHGRNLDDRSRFETDTRHALEARVAHIRHPVTDGKIAPLDAVLFELSGQPVMGGVRFRNDQKPACVLVDAMDDARSLLTSDAGQVAAKMVKQRIHQRASGATRRRVNDHTSRLVHHDDVIVLEDDRQRNVFGNSLYFSRLVDPHIENIAFRNPQLRIADNRTTLRDRARFQKPGKSRSAEMCLLWHITGQRLIKA